MERPGVGTGVYIRKDGKILMGKRRGKHGYGMFCPPGGKVEMNEEWEETCRREAMEEAGVEFENFRFVAVTNDITPEWQTHFITLHFVADWKRGNPRDNPEESIGEWDWYDWENLPDPLFHPARNFVNNGYNPLNL
jgi:8-oxo-dGTP diphosphatase